MCFPLTHKSQNKRPWWVQAEEVDLTDNYPQFHSPVSSGHSSIFRVAGAMTDLQSCVSPLPLTSVRLCVTPWTAARQAPLSVGFSRQEYWRELPFPPPGDLPDPGIEPISPALAGGLFTTEPPGKPPSKQHKHYTSTVLQLKVFLKSLGLTRAWRMQLLIAHLNILLFPVSSEHFDPNKQITTSVPAVTSLRLIDQNGKDQLWEGHTYC